MIERAVAVAALAVLSFTAPVQAEACTTTPGERIVLKANTIDSDVFVWDRRELLIDYASGAWPGTKAVLAHTLLFPAGTIALAIACQPAVIRPKLSSAVQDAIAIRILSGLHRGRTGWVASSDVHHLRRVHTKRRRAPLLRRLSKRSSTTG